MAVPSRVLPPKGIFRSTPRSHPSGKPSSCRPSRSTTPQISLNRPCFIDPSTITLEDQYALFILKPIVAKTLDVSQQVCLGFKHCSVHVKYANKTGALAEEWDQGDRKGSTEKFVQRMQDAFTIAHMLFSEIPRLRSAAVVNDLAALRTWACKVIKCLVALLPTYMAAWNKLGYNRMLGAICERWAEQRVDALHDCLDKARKLLLWLAREVMALYGQMPSEVLRAEGLREDIDWKDVLDQQEEVTEEALDMWQSPVLVPVTPSANIPADKKNATDEDPEQDLDTDDSEPLIFKRQRERAVSNVEISHRSLRSHKRSVKGDS